MRLQIKIFVFAIFFFIVVPNINAQTEKIVINGYELSSKEMSLIKWCVYDDFMGWAEGRKSSKTLKIILDYPERISSVSLQNDYEENEVRADIKYKDKQFIVYGTISSINRSFGDNYYLTLSNGYNRLIGVNAGMENGFVNYLVRLNKGQNVNLVCLGNGMSLGSAVLSQCEPIENWITKRNNDYFDKIVSNAKKNDEILFYVCYSISLKNIIPETSDCYSIIDNYSWDKCRQDIFQDWQASERKDKIIEGMKYIAEQMNLSSSTRENFEKHYINIKDGTEKLTTSQTNQTNRTIKIPKLPSALFSFDTNLYCNNKTRFAEKNKNQLLENCIKIENEAKKELEKMTISGEIARFCASFGECDGGSYLTTINCVRHEIETRR